MMSAAAKNKKSVSPRRRSMLAKVHIAKKDLGLSDDEYRGIINAKFGVQSSSKLSDKRLVELLESFKGMGFTAKKSGPVKQPAKSPQPSKEKERQIRKLKALWISLYRLGVTYDRSDDGLTAFARRVSGGAETGIRSINWLDQYAAANVIEALKKMAEREASVDWSSYQILRGTLSVPYYKPRARVIEAQWAIMYELDLVEIRDPGALSSYARRICKHAQHCSYERLSAEQLDQVIVVFGNQIRARLKAKGCETLKEWRDRQ